MVIKQVNEARFLGVTHDENLNWKSHIHKLSKKLLCSAGILTLIKDSIPEDLYKSLYFTLFESHLSYGITVWGGVSNNKLELLFKLQKKCMRILFGDKEAYLNKFKTCARSRPLDNQILVQEFYVGSLIWNAVRDLIKLYEFSQNSGSAKCVLKREILKIQKGGDRIEWQHGTWNTLVKQLFFLVKQLFIFLAINT